MSALLQRRAISLPRNTDFATDSYTSGVPGPMKAFVFLISFLCGLSSAAPSRPRGFAFAGVSNRFITPNGDGRNDNAVFRFTNPRDDAGSLKIYDARGRLVAAIAIGAGDTSATWDARAGGSPVPAGVYLFVIRLAGDSASGAVAVVR